MHSTILICPFGEGKKKEIPFKFAKKNKIRRKTLYFFVGKLCYQEGDWVKQVLLCHLDNIMKQNLSVEDRNLASLLIDLGEKERVDLKYHSAREPINISYDVINWRKNKFKEPLYNYKMKERLVNFSTAKDQNLMIESFNKRFSYHKPKDYYHEAMEFIRPRYHLLHNLSYR